MSESLKKYFPPWRDLVGMVIGSIVALLLFSVFTSNGSTFQPLVAPIMNDSRIIETSFWNWAATARLAISAVIASGIGWVFWRFQTWSTEKRTAEREKAAAALKLTADNTLIEKGRLEREAEELNERVEAAEKAVSEIRNQISLMDQTVRPLFEATKLKLIQSLTHPSPEFKVPDDLLAKVKDPNGKITNSEMAKLEKLLIERSTSTHPEVTPEEKLAAAILPTVIKLAKIEADSVSPILELQLVSVIKKEDPDGPKGAK